MPINIQIIFISLIISSCRLFTSSASTIIHEVNDAIFLDPQTHSALIRCPLDVVASSDIQWYDVVNHRYELDRGRYYRINGSQSFDREYICSSLSSTGAEHEEKYRMRIRTYGKT
jgi:hypothetical protein